MPNSDSPGFQQAVTQLRRAATADGFVASTTSRHNYRRIWGRDGTIISLAALQLEDGDFKKTVLSTLRTLMRHQGPHGEIPSNVDVAQGHVSYGSTAGRVDANLWFLIGCHQYWRTTGDDRFLEEFLPAIQKVEFLLGAWEYNTKGLLYIPETGDWADEYLQHGYVLYDQLLYWRALVGLNEMYQHANSGSRENYLYEKAGRLLDLIRTNYWFNNHCDSHQTDAYHPYMYKKGCAAATERDTYWLPYFSPTGYGYRFDAMANVLCSLLKVADEKQQDKIDKYIEDDIVPRQLKLLPAFSPVIEEIDKDWEELQSTFSYTFKNKPYEYHNGGLWPLITGFYAADLAGRGQKQKARQYLEALHQANRMDAEGGEWGFHEFINGQTFQPGGTRHQTWSASAAVMGHLALAGKTFL